MAGLLRFVIGQLPSVAPRRPFDKSAEHARRFTSTPRGCDGQRRRPRANRRICLAVRKSTFSQAAPTVASARRRRPQAPGWSIGELLLLDGPRARKDNEFASLDCAQRARAIVAIGCGRANARTRTT